MSRFLTTIAPGLILGVMFLGCASERPSSPPIPWEGDSGVSEDGIPLDAETRGVDKEEADGAGIASGEITSDGLPFPVRLDTEGDLGGTWASRDERQHLLNQALAALARRDQILREESGQHITRAWAVVEMAYPNVRVWVKATTSQDDRGEAWLWKSSPMRPGYPVAWSHFILTDVPLEEGCYLQWENFEGRQASCFVRRDALLEELDLSPVRGFPRGPGDPGPAEISPCEITAISVSAWHCLWWSIGCGPFCGLGCGVAMGVLWALACN